MKKLLIMVFSILFPLSFGTLYAEQGDPATPTPQASQTNQTTQTTQTPQATQTNLEGKYTCKGYDPFTKGNYVNYYSITKTGDVYAVKWVDSKGYPTAFGTGIINSKSPNIFAVGYFNMFSKENTGVCLYQIAEDGTLNGRWTIKGDDKVGTDVCKKQ